MPEIYAHRGDRIRFSYQLSVIRRKKTEDRRQETEVFHSPLPNTHHYSLLTTHYSLPHDK